MDSNNDNKFNGRVHNWSRSREVQKMIKPWECPKNCPNRKIGCQNPNTCENYRLRTIRSGIIRGDRVIKPAYGIRRSNPSLSGTWNTGKRK